MPDVLLLRFRDLTPGVNTISTHNEIANAKGRVLWGWWKKPLELMPDPGLTNLATDLRPDSKVFLVDSATAKIYRVNLLRIHFVPGGKEQPPPEPDLCPGYYRTQLLPAWFEIGKIEENPLEISCLASYVFSHNNRSAPKQSAAALPDSAIGQPVLDIDFLDSNLSLWLIVDTDEVGIRGRSSLVKGLSRGVWPIKGSYAIHLSDLHFGPQHVFRNQLATNRNLHIAKESLLEALLQDLEAIHISDSDVALILVTGDLTWSGDPHEFANALDFFQSLCRKLGLHSSQLIIVPGNHDIEWVKGKGEIDDNAELNYFNFCKEFYGVTPEKSFLRIHRFVINGTKVSVVALNSCRIESRENAGLGFVGRDQLGECQRFLNNNRDDGEIRLALIHHHLLPVNYIEGMDWETKKVSLTLDADAVLRCLISARVRAVMHGHQHQPFYSSVRRMVPGFVDHFNAGQEFLDGTIAVIGGGSIGADRSHLNVIGRNSYNIIDLREAHRLVSVRTRVQSSSGPGFSEYHAQPIMFEY
ncbi:MAG: hypothetical protein K0S45_4347 [Nitrospira sp.]|jgi:3',5'-cyclic AMP phosphodiesterase CpdA|nr:hypothetical protein [Nitrospira sp.]